MLRGGEAGADFCHLLLAAQDTTKIPHINTDTINTDTTNTNPSDASPIDRIVFIATFGYVQYVFISGGLLTPCLGWDLWRTFGSKREDGVIIWGC